MSYIDKLVKASEMNEAGRGPGSDLAAADYGNGKVYGPFSL